MLTIPRLLRPLFRRLKGKDLNPGALTGVWAPQNTREAIWDALKARENGYAQGVPMGGTLKGDSGAPSFTV